MYVYSSLSFAFGLESPRGLSRGLMNGWIGIGKNRTANAIEECEREGGRNRMICCRRNEARTEIEGEWGEGEGVDGMYCFVRTS